MDSPFLTTQSDTLSRPLCADDRSRTSDEALGRLLLEDADPVIAGVVRNKLRVSLSPADGSRQNQDAVEVCGDIRASILGELRRLDARPDRPPIQDFRKYVAVVAYHACYEYLRRKYPRRHSLKNKLRYVLTHDGELGLWEDAAGEHVCGLASWTGERASAEAGGRLTVLRREHLSFVDQALGGRDPERVPLAELLRIVCRWAGAGVELDSLVGAVAALCRLNETPETQIDEERISKQYRVSPELATGVADEVEQRLYLARLWEEVLLLPVRQRVALLLNLRDEQGRGATQLLPLTGVATIERIADALEISAANLADIWDDLPLEDAAIAERLALTRQQVINLRKAARARLARRTKDF